MRTLDCRERKIIDPFQGGMETFEIQWSLSIELAKEAQSREDGMGTLAVNQKLDSRLCAQEENECKEGTTSVIKPGNTGV